MKKNVIALLLAVVMASGNVGTVPALAAEATTQEAVAVEEETVEDAEEESAETEDAGTGEVSEDTTETESVEETEEVSEQELTEDIDTTEDAEEADTTEVDEVSEETEMPEEIEDPEETGTMEEDTAEDTEDEDSAVLGDTSTDMAVEEEPDAITEEGTTEVEAKEAALAGEENTNVTGKIGDNITWDLENGILRISGTGKVECGTSASENPFYNLEINELIIDEGITELGNLFWFCSSIKILRIPSSLKRIAQGNFQLCDSLSEVHITDIESWLDLDRQGYIHGDLYLNGEKLTELVIPYGITTIKNSAFWGCTSITHITLPNSVTSIEESAFDGCESLIDIQLSDGLNYIGERAFCGCQSMEYIEVPDSVIEIGEAAFTNCINLKDIHVSNSVDVIKPRTFENCNNLARIDIPKGVSVISASAFLYCESLESIDLPEGVTTIEGSAFAGCFSLKRISIPSSVNEIGEYAFLDDKNLKEIHIDDVASWVSMKWNDSANANIYLDGEPIKELIIPEGVTQIRDCAFSNCKTLESVIIPEGVTRIGERAFEYCDSLSSIILPNTLSGIGARAFTGCESLTDILIPNGVTFLGDDFVYGSNVYSIAVPASVTDVGTNAFRGIRTIFYRGIEKDWLRLTANVSLYYVTEVYIATIPVEGVSIEENIDIYNEPAKILVNVFPSNASIKDVVWSYNSDLINIDENGVVTRVSGNNTECEVKVTASTVDGGYQSACYIHLKDVSVRSISINTSEAVIEQGDTYSLESTITPSYAADKSVYWSSSASEIVTVDQNGLINALSVGEAKITVKALEGGFTSSCRVIVLPSATDNGTIRWNIEKDEDGFVLTVSGKGSIKDFGEESPFGTVGDNITAIIIEDGIEGIGKNAFSSLNNLQSVELPESLHTIGGSSFKNCSSLSGVFIPEGVTFIGEEAFQNCPAHISVIKGSYAEEYVISNQLDYSIVCNNHEWNKEYTIDQKPTCAEAGSESIHCAICDVINEDSVRAIPKKDHEYSNWTVTKEATCTEDGSKEKVCMNCGDKAVEIIPATGHVWNEEYTVDKESTCTEEGVESIHCSLCDAIDETTVRAIEKKDHEYSNWTVTKEATCTEDGSKVKVCADCNDKVTEVIPAKGHVWNEEYTVDKEASYTEEGFESIHCSVCGETKEGTQKSIAKLLKPLSLLTIADITDKTYTGKAQSQAVVVKDGITTLKNGTHYTVSYKNNTNAGTASVVITGKGNYTGTVTKTFTINKAANAITAGNFTKAYSTKAQSFSLGAKATGGTLTYASNNKSVTVDNAGKVTVKAKFIGNAAITITAQNANYNQAIKRIKITVNPNKTALSSAKNSASKKMTVKWKKNAAGSGYQIQYSTAKNFKGAKTVTIKKNKIVTKTIGGLKKGKKYYVRVRTYKAVGKLKFYSGWSTVKKVAIKK